MEKCFRQLWIIRREVAGLAMPSWEKKMFSFKFWNVASSLPPLFSFPSRSLTNRRFPKGPFLLSTQKSTVRFALLTCRRWHEWSKCCKERKYEKERRRDGFVSLKSERPLQWQQHRTHNWVHSRDMILHK